jgi:non-ribosomal peptide synthetase component F
MSRRPNVSQTLAMKAAAAAAREVEQEDADASLAPVSQFEAAPPGPEPQPVEVEERARSVGRPKGRRTVAARQTVYLDDARHAALARIAEDRGRSIHSLILEGIDHVIGKPTAKGWQ